MHPSKARFVTACQQTLALGAVLAVLAPAAGVVSLDVIGQHPGAAQESPSSPSEAPGYAAPAKLTPTRVAPDAERSDSQPAEVAAAPVDAQVREVPLEKASDDDQQSRAGGQTAASPGAAEVTSTVEAVDGFGTVGVTWSNQSAVGDGELSIKVRTQKDGTWSSWSDVPYDADHGPDPGSAEAAHVRPGTDAVVVGDVDNVQVKASGADGTTPDDMQLAVIDPGTTPTEVEAPAIDTSLIDEPGDTGLAPSEPDTDAIALQSATTKAASVITSKPKIFSRAQWGADERLRDPGSLHYFEVHAGFVHHTVNANDYTKAEVPGILRSIYAYHTQSKGWSDIGYNFLVDRFGRIWEGRYGGVSLPVVGAHTLGYNDYAFAMSAIGNFETARPSAAMLDAYARLFAWKLSLHGVDVSSTRQRVGSTYFQAINGHRDAGQTACPGKYLYAKIPEIRTLAAQYQASWAGRQRDADAVSTPYPDIFLRRASDGAGFLLPTQGLVRFGAAKIAATGSWDEMDTIIATPDVTGDRFRDVFARNASTGEAMVYPGDGTGHFGDGIKATTRFRGFDQITAVGDLDGDGNNDLVGHNPLNGRLRLFAGGGAGGFTSSVLSTAWTSYDLTIGTGDFDGDDHPDILSRDAAGRLWLHPGTGRSALGSRVRLSGTWGGFDVITGYGDYNRDGRPDLLARSASTKKAYVFPNLGTTTFGHWLGPLLAFSKTELISSGGNLVNGGPTDMLGRRGDALVVIAHRGTWNTSAPVATGLKLGQATMLLNVGDWDRDGDGDLIVRTRIGELRLRIANGDGTFAPPETIGTGFDKVGLLSAVGDLTGDGYPDLMGQPTGGAMRIYPGRGLSGLKPSYVAHSRISASRQVGAGLWNRDGSPDSIFRIDDQLVLYPGNGPGGLTSAISLGEGVARYDWVLGVGDISGSGHADVIARQKSTGDLWVLPGTATGFGDRIFLAQGLGDYDLAG
ncbi:N-acetylmuramoyl-L-alanine amidase, family 2 [metagenome]|uniref:N-acetylmuramoyl-L-alanine amidase, family 2 n=1 Tax=metagenome TaxID=256318 RepID=A0A2P2CBU1_9ZZZZ